MAITSKIFPVYSTGIEVVLPFSVVNNTNEVARNVVLTFDPMPAGVTFESALKDVGTFVDLDLEWTILRLNPGEAQTLYLKVTVDDVDVDQLITGSVVGAENADYPGESETDFSYTITKHPLGRQFQGYEEIKSLSIRSTGTGEYPFTDSGVIYVLGTTTGNVDYRLPALSSVDAGTIFGLKVIDDNANVVRILENASDTNSIEGGVSSLTLVTGQFVQVVAIKGGPLNLWGVITDVTA